MVVQPNLSKSKRKFFPIVIALFFLLFVGIGLLVYFIAYCENAVPEHDELIFANTICRHGDRNSLSTYPGDPWQDEKYWEEGYGQLTKLGKQQHYELGKYFRKRYASLLDGDGCIGDKIYVNSTEKDRTIDSAKANLEGLFSMDGSSNSSCDWKSVPVHTVPFEEECLLAFINECNHFDYLMIQYENTTAYRRLFEENEHLIEYLESKTGLKLRTLKDLVCLYDAFDLEQQNNYHLPDWAEELMKPPSSFECLALQWFVIHMATPEMRKFRSGFLLRDILNRFMNEIQHPSSEDRRLWLYFSHDIVLTNLMDTLGVFELHVPPYASCVLFELYRSKKGDAPYVQVFYRNTTETNIAPLEIPKCGTKCPLNKMFDLYDEVLPKRSFDEECALRDGETLPPGGNPEKVVFV